MKGRRATTFVRCSMWMKRLSSAVRIMFLALLNAPWFPIYFSNAASSGISFLAAPPILSLRYPSTHLSDSTKPGLGTVP